MKILLYQLDGNIKVTTKLYFPNVADRLKIFKKFVDNISLEKLQSIK